MGRRLRLIFTAILVSGTLLASTPTTGNLSGRVTDPSGAPLSAVVLTLRGPHLPGLRTATTNLRGEYRFAELPPGDEYRLAASLPGFQPIVTEKVVIPLGRDVALDFAMRPAVSEEMTVSAARPLIDVSSATTATNITSDQIDALPTRRDFQQLAILAPSAVFDRDKLNPAIGGATHLENDYMIEGLSTRDPRDASSATNLTMNYVEEIQVVTSGLPAEYGRALGGVINVVTKSGSNELKGDLVAYDAQSAWASKRVTSAFHGADSFDLGTDRRDIGLSIGGPIARDRVWFFGAFDPRHDVTPSHFTDPILLIDRNVSTIDDERVFAGKVNAAMAASQSLTLSIFGNPARTDGWLSFPQGDPATALKTNHSGSRNFVARYDGTAVRGTTFEVSAGRQRQHLESIADTATGRDVPLQTDFSGNYGGYERGGAAGLSADQTSRDSLSLRATHEIGAHEVRAGGDVERNRYDRVYRQSIFYFYGQQPINSDIGTADLLIERSYDNSGVGSNRGSDAFIQDRWELLPSVTVTAGLRYEAETLGATQGVAIATGRNPDGTLTRQPAKSFTLDGNWAPRLGVAWDVSRRGRAKLYASAGRYFESIPVEINVDAFNGFGTTFSQFYGRTEHTHDNWYNPNGSPLNSDWVLLTSSFSRLNSYGAPTGPVPIAEDLRLEYQDEWSVGGEMQLGSSWVASARLLSRELRRPIDDHSVMLPGSATIAVDEIISNVGESEFSREFRTPRRSYRALELAAQRRLTNRWQVMASFVSARERGDFDGSYDYLNGDLQGSGGPNETYLVELPAWQENNYGRMRGDVPYRFKVHSSYALPFGLTVSEGFVYSAGTPISAVSARRLDGGVRARYLLPRGSVGRMPDNWTLDLHADWRVPVLLHRGTAVSFIADVFNATNEHGPLDVDPEYFWRGQPSYSQWVAPSNLDAFGNPKFNPNLPVSPYFNTPTRYQQPRALQVGVKVAF